MKKLIWKELMEMRWIPVAYAALAVMALGIWRIYGLHSLSFERATIDSAGWVGLFGILATGLLPGCHAISAEVNSGTLQFLTLLPAGRRNVWLAKVSAGLLIMAFSAVSIVSVLSVQSLLFFGPARLAGLFHFLWTMEYAGYLALAIFAGALTFYFISLLVSTLLDSTVAALVVSATSSVGFFFVTILFINTTENHVQWAWLIPPATLCATLFACIAASCLTFCKGQDLRTPRQFKVALSVLLAGFMIGWGSIGVYAHFLALPYGDDRAEVVNLGRIQDNETKHFSIKLNPRNYPRYLHVVNKNLEGFTNLETVPYRLHGHTYTQLEFDCKLPAWVAGSMEYPVYLSDSQDLGRDRKVLLNLYVINTDGFERAKKTELGRVIIGRPARTYPLYVDIRPRSHGIYRLGRHSPELTNVRLIAGTPQSGGCPSISYSYIPKGPVGEREFKIELYDKDGKPFEEFFVTARVQKPRSHR